MNDEENSSNSGCKRRRSSGSSILGTSTVCIADLDAGSPSSAMKLSESGSDSGLISKTEAEETANDVSQANDATNVSNSVTDPSTADCRDVVGDFLTKTSATDGVHRKDIEELSNTSMEVDKILNTIQSTAEGSDDSGSSGIGSRSDHPLINVNNSPRSGLRNRGRCYRRSGLDDSSSSNSSPVPEEKPAEVHSATNAQSDGENSDDIRSIYAELSHSPMSQHSNHYSLHGSDSSPLSSPMLADNEVTNTSDSHSDVENSIELRSLHAVSSELQRSIQRHMSEDNSQNGSLGNFGQNDESDDTVDDDIINDNPDEMRDDEEANQAEQVTLNDVISKPKPNYTWNSTYELMRREHGLAGDGRSSLRNGMSPGFNTRFYSSLHVVERIKLSHCLRKHNGCVNCLNFNRSGDLLCSGSDDTRIVVWNWAHSKTKHVFKSGHTENIFQTKFIPSMGCLDIVSASRDGQVRRSIIPSGGGRVQSTCLYKHRGAVHKLVICPQSTFEIISVGEDGFIRQKDLRSDDKVSDMLKVVKGKKNKKVRLFSISHHPFAPEICVCGCDNFVRVYDKRNMAKPVHEMCPDILIETSIPQVTCSVYNNNGSEILASYCDDHIYLFNNKAYKTGEYLHRYRGHYNHRTIKGVNFFGLNSEYIVSGSDCGNIFFWDKSTEAIVNYMPGDTMGVNCLEPHPSIPVLATSGLDHNIKIWTPSRANYPPDFTKLETCVRRNLKRSVIDDTNDFGDRQFQYYIRQFLRRARATFDDNDDDDISNVTDTNAWSSSSSSSSSESLVDEELPRLDGFQCRTQ